MEVKHWFRVACLAGAAFGQSAWALETSKATKEQLIAPTVVQASYDNCRSCSSICDSAADTGCDSGCGGILSRNSIFGGRSLFSGCGFGSACDTNGCDSGCGAGTGCASECDASGCDGLVGKDCGLLGYGLIKHSDPCFNDFISPMTNPVFFEDPRTLSEARFIFINHNLPTALGGNSVQVYAMQVRAAITKRLSIIATKDGFIYTQSPVLDSGYADIAAGLKYNLYRDPVKGRLLSAGMTYEAPSGSNRSLQGNGNGEFHFFTTGGTRVGAKSHWLSASGLRQPADTNLENKLWYWSNHFDRQIGNRPVYAFTEVNWYHYSSNGNAFPLPVQGGDLFNLGSPGIQGDNLVTLAFGSKAKPRRNQELGVAYEFPVSALQGLMANRLTVDWIIRY